MTDDGSTDTDFHDSTKDPLSTGALCAIQRESHAPGRRDAARECLRMSPINRSGNPRMGPLRCRRSAGVMAAAIVAITGLSARPVVAQNIVVSDGAVQSNTSPVTYDSIDVFGTDGNRNPSTYNADATLTLRGFLSAHDLGIFNANADVNTDSASASTGGVINLNAGILTAQSLAFNGPGSVTRSGGHYSTNSLTLSNGAALGYDTGDTIDNAVSLASGAALTLAKDLNLSGGIDIDGAATTLASAGQAISASYLNVNHGATVTFDQNLSLSGNLSLDNAGSIVRTSETISALGFTVVNATLDLLAGDTFSPFDASSVQNGALVNAPAGTALGPLNVYGTNGNGDRATFNVNGDVTVNGSAGAFSDGVINLIAGTLSTPNLSFSGAGSAGQSGGNYDVTDLLLSGGATLTIGLGDSIDSLSVAGAGSLLDAFAPLTLSSLSLGNGGVLYLGAFTGTGAISNWGLRVTGDDTVFLQSLIELGLLTAGLSPLSVIFDAGTNMTYVTFVSAAVPEIDPTTAHGAVVLLVGALGLLERRLRQAAIARHAA